MISNPIKHLYVYLIILIVSNFAISQVNIIAPPATSHGHWHQDKFRNLDRLLIMTEGEVNEIRSRILQGNNIFSKIYSNDYKNRDGGVISGIYQNALRTTPNNRIDRAVLAKNKAFVALIGINGSSSELYEMSETERNSFRDQAIALLRNFDNSAWSDQDRPDNFIEDIAFLADHLDEIYDLQYRSRELICYLEAYDMLRPIGSARVWEENIARRLIKFASNIYFLADYFGSYYAYNNHRIISGAALGMAGILFGDWGADDGDFDDRDSRSYMPTAWVGYGMININTVLYSYQVFPDGGYNEGPHYLRYSFVHALPFFKAMKNFGEVFHLSDAGKPYGDWIESYSTFPGNNYSLRSPWYGRRYDAKPDLWDILDWITKIRQPEGRVPGIANTFNDTYFPETSIAGGYYFWPQTSYESGISGNEILNWALSAYTDSRADFIAAGNTFQDSPPDWGELQIFPQTGDIVFRSGWELDDIYMHVYARNYTYSSSDFHRDSHIQHDNSSFLLGFKGHILALDAGYISWNDKDQVNNPYNHNLILVHGLGPSKNSTTVNIENSQSGGFYDYVRIGTNYQGANIRRGFIFYDDRYFIIKDRIDGSITKAYQFLLHGNDINPVNESDGVRWQKEDAILKVFVTTNGGNDNLILSLDDYIHDNGYGLNRVENHKRLSAGRVATDMQFLTILFPYDADLQEEPEIVDVVDNAYAAVFIDRTSHVDFGNRYELILSQWSSSRTVTIPENQYGLNNRTIKAIKTDAALLTLSFDPSGPDDPNKINFFHKDMTTLDYGPYVLFPQFAPKIAMIPDITMNEMDTLQVTITASDTNGHYLSFTSYNLPSFAQVIDNGDGTGVIRFTPDYMNAGIYNNIQILVTDSGKPSMTDSEVFTLTVHNVNLAPTAIASSNVTVGTPPMLVVFFSYGNDLDGSIQSLLWDFGDGSTSTNSFPPHTYHTAGKHHAILTVTDNEGATGSDTVIIKNHPDLSQLFISEVSYADQPHGEFLEIFNNASYDINLREFKLIQLHAKGYLKDVYDIGRDEIWDDSEMIVPFKQVLVIGRNTDATTFADYWQLEPGTINFNGADLIFGVPPSRWLLRYFDGSFDQNDGTIIDDTQSSVSGLERRSYQYGDGLWRTSTYLEATPGYLDGDQSLPVELVAFKTEVSENSILLRWETQSELNNRGFKILRSIIKDSLYIQIASFLEDDNLLGQGNNSSGKKYQYLDKDVLRNVTFWYKIVDVDLSGRESHHGPVMGMLNFINNNLFVVDAIAIPNQFKLYNNFPNPFNASTSIRFDIPDTQTDQNPFAISIYDISGRKVTDLYQGSLTPGQYQVKWNGKNEADLDMASGLYILSLQSPSYFSSKKMILLR